MRDLACHCSGALCFDPTLSDRPRLRLRSQREPDGCVIGDVGRVIVCPRWIQPTFDAVAECAEHGVDIAIVLGSRITALVRSQMRDGMIERRRRQYRRHADADAVLALVRSLIATKTLGQYNLLRRAAHRSDSRLAMYADRIAADRSGLIRHGTIVSLRGLEGHIARMYFAAWPIWTGLPGFRRIPHRRHDPINVLLDIGYSRLCQAVTLALLDAGCDIAVGSLHEEDDRRPVLALDVMEPLRPLVVDRFVLRVAARAQQGWLEHSPEGWRLSSHGAAAFQSRWQSWWFGSVRRPGQEEHVKQAVRTYVRWLDGEQDLHWPTAVQ